jgi:hypothetical protein
MQENNDNTEFELSFDFMNVLYIAQVIAKQGPNGPYYSITYFSPNEKGEIPVLIHRKHAGGESWEEPSHSHESAFIQEIGRQLEKKNVAE